MTQSILVAIPSQESLQQILAFMVYGLIIRMVATPLTVIQTASSTNLRYILKQPNQWSVCIIQQCKQTVSQIRFS